MKSLFMAEFGEPTIEKYISSNIKPIFIVADSFASANIIAETYLESELDKTTSSVVNSNGDLILNKDKVCKVASIKIISETIYG